MYLTWHMMTGSTYSLMYLTWHMMTGTAKP